MKKIKRFLQWIFYWFITTEERHLYDMGNIKGYHCKGYEQVGFETRDYIYDISKKPQRNFKTFKEFMQC